MEQILKPDKLELDPQAVGASNSFDHWLKCFEAFLDASAVVRSETDKLHVLHARVSDIVYSTIRDAETYKDTIELLKGQWEFHSNFIAMLM